MPRVMEEWGKFSRGYSTKKANLDLSPSRIKVSVVVVAFSQLKNPTFFFVTSDRTWGFSKRIRKWFAINHGYESGI